MFHLWRPDWTGKSSLHWHSGENGQVGIREPNCTAFDDDNFGHFESDPQGDCDEGRNHLSHMLQSHQ